MMKRSSPFRFAAFFLAALLLLSCASCSSSPAESTPSAGTSSPDSSAPEPSVPTDAPTLPEPSSEAPAGDEPWFPFDANGDPVLTGRDAEGREGAVASSSWYASKAGLDVLKAGGNAVDAAIAVSYALGVTEPYTSGLGGGGFMLVYEAASGKVNVIDYRETAPAAAAPGMWLEEDGTVGLYVGPDGTVFTGGYSRKNQVGGLAAAVPGEVAGMEYALEHFGSGRLSRRELMESAIRLAREGYAVTPTLQKCTSDEYYEISQMEDVSAYYLDDIGLPPAVGSSWKNEDLAAMLEKIADGGADAFYRGETAQAIAEAVSRYGGVMTAEDLAAYRVEVREPVASTYRGYRIFSLPPASSGGTHLIETLNILENFDVAGMEVNGEQALHLFAEAFKLSFADRAAYMADTAFADVPLEGLTSKEYAKVLAAKIGETCASYDAGDPFPYEHGSTTSFSVVDRDGNMVACTQTVGDFYGCKIAVPGLGFLLNDEMADFSADPDSVNCVAGGKRPLSSMSPTIVLTPEGKPFLTVGTPGGTRIWPTIVQVISRMIDSGMDIQEAIECARIFDDANGVLHYESKGSRAVSGETAAALAARGHELNDRGGNDLYFGGVQGIEIRPDGTLHGGADPRRDGKALAY